MFIGKRCQLLAPQHVRRSGDPFPADTFCNSEKVTNSVKNMWASNAIGHSDQRINRSSMVYPRQLASFCICFCFVCAMPSLVGLRRSCEGALSGCIGYCPWRQASFAQPSRWPRQHFRQRGFLFFRWFSSVIYLHCARFGF